MNKLRLGVVGLGEGRNIISAALAGDDWDVAGICDLKEGRRMLEAVNKTGKTVFVGQSSRFFEPMMRQREAFDEGRLGEFCTMESAYNADHRWFLA